jgi:hypothetical protein
MKKELNQIGDIMGQLRDADNVHYDVCLALCTQIVTLLTSLREQGETREACFTVLERWNKNTKDGVEIRSRKTLNNWLRDAGFRARAERSDKGEVKGEAKKAKETKEQALVRAKALIAQYGFTAADLGL